ncbi:LysR substrate-binding domain-containing protein [Falsiroseomonas oryzae]|uniref:LysR substrate-binding domain-containing protein n=1 Tax=Falsiroseomonas oryzae TaxID=2766473 RepID=UPI0022EAC93B|nr:LysR substrate-binding domain-containing protein [Roseomonas sp. MO-31]
MARLRATEPETLTPLGQYRAVTALDGESPARRAQVHEPLARHRLVLAGAGAAWLPAFLCREDVALGRLLDLTPGAARGPLPIHALYTAQAATSPKVRAFVGFLVRITGALTPAG